MKKERDGELYNDTVPLVPRLIVLPGIALGGVIAWDLAGRLASPNSQQDPFRTWIALLVAGGLMVFFGGLWTARNRLVYRPGTDTILHKSRFVWSWSWEQPRPQVGALRVRYGKARSMRLWDFSLLMRDGSVHRLTRRYSEEETERLAERIRARLGIAVERV